MYKYNLKVNPELAKERHAMQQREYYKRNKEYIIAMQRERRLTQRLMKRCLVAQETIPLNQALGYLTYKPRKLNKKDDKCGK